MRKSIYTYHRGDVEITWTVSIYDDYCYIKEVNSVDGMNFICIPKKVFDSIFRKEV